MKPPSTPMSRAPTAPTSSGVPGRFATDPSIILRYPAPRGPESSSLASGVMTIPGLIVLTRAPRFPQCTASAMTAQRISALRELIRLQRVLHLIELEEGKLQQFLRRRHRQRLV